MQTLKHAHSASRHHSQSVSACSCSSFWWSSQCMLAVDASFNVIWGMERAIKHKRPAPPSWYAARFTVGMKTTLEKAVRSCGGRTGLPGPISFGTAAEGVMLTTTRNHSYHHEHRNGNAPKFGCILHRHLQ
eukprot:5939228-Amphidinium_carterae.2